MYRERGGVIVAFVSIVSMVLPDERGFWYNERLDGDAITLFWTVHTIGGIGGKDVDEVCGAVM
jgi:hypothetical protein